MMTVVTVTMMTAATQCGAAVDQALCQVLRVDNLAAVRRGALCPQMGFGIRNHPCQGDAPPSEASFADVLGSAG